MKKRLMALTMIGLLALQAPAFAAYTDNETVKSVQEALNKAGFDCGTPDGLFGSKTAEAIKGYQQSNGLSVSGEIDDELLRALQPADEPEAAAAVELQNEEAWNQLFLSISEQGVEMDELKGIVLKSDDYYTIIGIEDGDPDTIYLYTKAEYGSEAAMTITDLKIALKKNEGLAEFSVFSDFEIASNGLSAYTKENGYGHVAISEVTMRTELEIEQYSKEVLDIYGETKTTTDVSESLMSGTMSQSLGHLLMDTEQILRENTSVEMKDLGFLAY